jgi:hypothetical protein
LDWEINKKNKLISSYSYNTVNAKILDVYSDFVLTGSRSFSKGAGGFNQLNASSFIINYQFGNWTDRFFAKTFIFYVKHHDFYSTNTLVTQNFVQYQKILNRNRDFLSINTQVDFFLKFISSNLKVDLAYATIKFKNIVNNSDLRLVTSSNYNCGLELRSGFKGVFNYHIGTKWSTNQVETIIRNSFSNNVSFLDLTFLFNNRLDLQIQTERYYFGSLETDNSYYFFYFDVRLKLIKDKLIFGLAGKNLFDTKVFRNISISDIGTSTIEYRLLPRCGLLKMEYRF